MKHAKVIFLMLCLVFAGQNLFAHGTKYEIVRNEEIKVRAMYDSGNVMDNAKVLVFKPNSTKADNTLETDDKGVFGFTPDLPGTWTFQVRDKSGHGMRINLEIDEKLGLKGDSITSSGPTLIQKLIMAFCVIWGLIGTALFFKRKGGQA